MGNAEVLELALVRGDLKSLSAEQRVIYYNKVCESVGLNPLTRPFEYMVLNGREVLYARKDATDQLRSIHKISIEITSREKIGDVFSVTAKAKNADGRTDESVGAVPIVGLKADALANALMKAETKAKRRVTLSICGLGLLDETEVEAIPGASLKQDPKELPSAPKTPQQDVLDYNIRLPGPYLGKKLEDVPIKALRTHVDVLREKQKKARVSLEEEEFIRMVSVLETMS